jgi:hypothetical protein
VVFGVGGSMKERPILFNGAMVRALLDGSKTQMRRIVKPAPQMVTDKRTEPWDGDPSILLRLMQQTGKHCPFGQVGDQLWVRETFQPVFSAGREHGENTPDWGTGEGYDVKYPATDEIIEWIDGDDNITSRCKPSIHMPRWASRIQLEITGVRVERLNDITDSDAFSEGINQADAFSMGCTIDAARSVFSVLWESVYGPGSWDTNPWVWVLDFKRAAA